MIILKATITCNDKKELIRHLKELTAQVEYEGVIHTPLNLRDMNVTNNKGYGRRTIRIKTKI